MGIGEVWMKWIEAIVFSSQMSVMVNGSPIEDFEVSRGLRQGDPLSFFLYVIIAKCLAGLIRKVSNIGEFKGFNVHEKCKLDIL